jgi:CO/xanthine dehydrogenase Mo-binding subunit
MAAPDVHGDFVTSTMNNIADQWLYTGAANVIERGHGAHQVGQKASPIDVGLRDHSMRTPVQFQQNYPRELAISEAAALAGVDAIEFRIHNTREERAIGVLKAVRDASGWDTRPSPNPNAVSVGAAPVRGRGVSLMLRDGTYWACVCHIAVTPSTGAVSVEKCTMAVDPGIVINPVQLNRQVEGGIVMGISMALLEEVAFDESGVTQEDWLTYPILTMADMPEIKVELIHNPKVGKYGGGSEAANALAASAIAAALHDATGKAIRRLPMKPAYVQAVLKA